LLLLLVVRPAGSRFSSLLLLALLMMLRPPVHLLYPNASFPSFFPFFTSTTLFLVLCVLLFEMCVFLGKINRTIAGVPVGVLERCLRKWL